MANPFAGCKYEDHVARAVENFYALADPKELLDATSELVRENDGFFTDMLTLGGEIELYEVVWGKCAMLEKSDEKVFELFSKTIKNPTEGTVPSGLQVFVAQKLIETGRPEEASTMLQGIQPELLSTESTKGYYHMLMKVLISSNVTSGLYDDAIKLFQSEHYNVKEAEPEYQAEILKNMMLAYRAVGNAEAAAALTELQASMVDLSKAG